MMAFLFVIAGLVIVVEVVWAAGNAHGYERGRRDERRFGR